MREHLPTLVEDVVRSAIDDRLNAQHDAQLRKKHHRSDAAREAGNDWLGDKMDVTAESQNAKDEHEDGGHNADFGSATDTLQTNRLRYEGDGGTGRATN